MRPQGWSVDAPRDPQNGHFWDPFLRRVLGGPDPNPCKYSIKTDQNWSEIVKNGSKWVKKGSKMATSGPSEEIWPVWPNPLLAWHMSG